MHLLDTLNPFSRAKRVTVVVATRHRPALRALAQAAEDLPLTRREAITTQGVYDALPGAHLVILDRDAVRETTISRQRLVAALEDGVVAATGPAFAAEPERFLDRARAASGLAGALPPRTVAFSGLSGGVGKTTLSLSLARAFRQATGLPVGVIELCSGPSGLLALLGDRELSHLYEVATQGAAWPEWSGITLAPMDWETARLLDEAQVAEAWQGVRAHHILTLLDAPAYHPLWGVAEAMAERVFVVADRRPDALAAAVYLASRDGGGRRILLNRAGVAARLALEADPAARLPDVGEAARRFPLKLGRRLMPVVYPGWRRR